MSKRASIATIAAAAFVTPATGMQTLPSTTPKAAPCADPSYHQFDFWTGRWDVFDPKGSLVAHSLVESVYGCGIRENWLPIGKSGGGSLSIYVPAQQHWEQFWIDSSGSRAFFTGGWNGSAMVISGNWGGPLVRMTYSKERDGSVRQFGEQSTDNGQNWKPSFDFTYRRSTSR